MIPKINDVNIEFIAPLLTPNWVKHKIALTDKVAQHIASFRNQIIDILNGHDHRMLLIVGPCSVHDPEAILDYATRLKKLADQVKNNILIVMRVYFEKPRTTIGWKGLINDPNLNNTCDINKGLLLAREILFNINQLGLPAANEFLDPITPQYIADLICWGAIGARTAESQVHRNLTSGMSMPIGIKNSTTGDTKVAVDAMMAAYHPNQFLSITNDGIAAIVKTKGNPNLQLILRGGSSTGPNYTQEYIEKAIAQIEKIQLRPNIMIDCSHGNSNKDHKQQSKVLDQVMQQLSSNYGKYINGLMLESFIKEGNQALKQDPSLLIYGQSITDSCISWQETEQLVLDLNQKITENNEQCERFNKFKKVV